MRIATFFNQLILVSGLALIAACGGVGGGIPGPIGGSSSGSVSSSSSTSSSSSSSSSSSGGLTLEAGRDQTVDNSAWVTLSGSNEGSSAASAVSWRQIAGPAVALIPDPTNPWSASFIAPDVSEETPLEFELSAVSGGFQFRDTMLVYVKPCDASGEVIFGDCIAPGFGPWLAYESSDRNGQLFHYAGVGNYHVQWQLVDSGDDDRGEVMEISWNVNDPAQQEDARGWFGLALPGVAGSTGADISAYLDGAISFNMRLRYHGKPSAPAPFIFKMECVHPCVSAEMPIRDGHTSFEWQTHTYALRELVASGLDLSKVNHVFVIQPDWFSQEQDVTVQIDNIRLSKTYTPPPPVDGCPSRGNVTYALARSANPTADEQEAYGLITSAMDNAVKNYNCYTNLSRHLQVTYNPGVQTADGNTNGAIRFGSRASMHHVTAMHEIAHTFGVGFAKFKSLIQNGVFTGPLTTAKAREISGDPSVQIKSDGTHFWPYGLNYVSEGRTQQDLIDHCLIVQTIVQDLAN